jgi:hypothetical protein
MEEIIIGFSRPKNHILPIFSWLIRAFQGFTEYSHVYLKFHNDILDRYIIFQASGSQVNYIGSKLFKEQVHIIEEFKLYVTDEQCKQIQQFAIDQAGKPYSIRNILGIVFRSNLFLDGNDGFICSELVGNILNEQFNMYFDKEIEFITPKDIYEKLKLRKS